MLKIGRVTANNCTLEKPTALLFSERWLAAAVKFQRFHAGSLSDQ